jgi:putative transposase
VIQNDEHLLTVLRYIEANPLRAEIVSRAEDYPWSSYRVHGCGENDALIDRLVTYEELSPYEAVRQRRWQTMVHRPLDEKALSAIRRSSATGLPYGDDAWVNRLAKRLDLDLTIRPRGRPRKETTNK